MHGTGEQKNSGGIMSYKVAGMPIPLFGGLAAIVLGGMITGSLPKDLGGSIALLFVLGVIFGEIGDRIPIWNEYVGGGAVLTFLTTSYMVHEKILPAAYVKSATEFMDKTGYLNLFIVILITGSLLSVNRKQLIRAISGYIPTILAGVAGAFVMGGIAGLLFDIPFKTITMLYVLPIMGGGNGGGAIPMSQIWGAATGKNPKEWYSVAITILTLANVICIIAGALLAKLGKLKPEWTGNGELLKQDDSALSAPDKVEEVNITLKEVAAGLFLSAALYGFGALMGKTLLPKIFGIAIHPFVYIVLAAAFANMLDIIPVEIKQGANKLQKFFSGPMLWLLLAGVGIAYTDMAGLIGAVSFTNFMVCAFVVIGAMVGCGVTGLLFRFYPIEAAISAGLCMANRGGSGDLEVLAAAKRMNLMSYAQISSRLGGGIMLVIASVIFSMWSK
jgi:Na+/citrate or Na+/malate symporter